MSAVIPAQTYSTMQERFAQFNTFLFPLPRDQGYEFIVVQFLGHEAHFTTLINYQVNQQMKHFILHLFDEFRPFLRR